MNPDAFSTLMLLGTGRLKEPPPSPFPVTAGAWAALDWSQPEAAALAGCALHAAATRAGFTCHREFVLPEPCDGESRPPAPAAAGAVLRHILGGEDSGCLREWLETCAAGGFIAAPRNLPALFDKAAQDPDLRPLVASIMGERGAWLSRRTGLTGLLPTSSTLTDESWETGTLPERTAWFHSVRQSDPPRAAAALTAAWPQESGENRVAFLKVIGGAPTDAELPLLENQALKDRTKEVRCRTHTALMARPDSAFAGRAFSRGRELFKVEGSFLTKRLVLTLPDAFDPAWKNDGLEEKVPAGSKRMGPRAFWAMQLLGLVPLTKWTSHFQLELPKLLALNKDPESAGVILLGWLLSAMNHPEPRAAEALAFHLAGLDAWPIDAPPVIPTFLRLTSALPGETAARIVEAAEANLIKSTAPGQLFSASRFPVPETAAPRWFSAILTGLQAQPYPLFQAAASRQLAGRLPISFLPAALRRISQEPALTTASESFARTLEFRLQLHQSFIGTGTADKRE